jgi:nitrogen fixation NifU-like protein
MYEEHVLQHYSKPFHKRPLPKGDGNTCQGSDVSVVCGDEVTINAKVEDGVIVDLWWRGEGCCFSQAAASMLVEFASGKSIAALREFKESDLLSLFQAECPNARRGCVFVSLNALRKLLESCP